MIKKISLFMCLIIIFVFAGCPDVKVPISELTKAKETITRAQELEANTYSKENLDNATSLLLSAHNHSVNGDEKRAKQSAANATAAAQKAIDESLPLRSANAIALAQSSAEAAKNFNAEEYANADYEEALKLLEEAEKLNSAATAAGFEEAFTVAHKSTEASQRAIETCKTHIPSIRRSLTETTNRRGEIARRSQNPEVQEILTSVQANINKANSSIDAGMLIVANNEIKEANTSLQQAQLIVNIDEQLARAEVLRNQITELRRADTNFFAEQELSAASSALGRTNASARNKDLEQTTELVASAARSIEEARSKITQAEAAARRLSEVKTAANNVFQRIPADANQFEAQVSQINNQLAQGDQFFTQKDLPNVLTTANNAERNINSLRTALDSHLAAQALAARQAQEAAAREAAAKKAAEEEAARIAAAAAEEEAVRRAAAEQARPRGEGDVFVVQTNQSLWGIAWRFYKEATFWPLIFVENKNQIKNPDLIFPGQQLTIPALDPDMSVNRENVRRIRREHLRNRDR